jgi:DNA-binding CsgD family transcriptional regulator
VPGFFFRPVDLSSLAFLFVALLVAWRLRALRPRTARSRWLTLFFLSSALLALFSVAAGGRLDAWRFYAIHLQIVASALGVAALLQYVYHVGDLDPDGKEARAILALSLVPLLYVLGWALYQFGQLAAQGEPTTSTSISEGLIGLGLLWTLVVALRQARHAARRPQASRPPGNLALLITGLVLLLAANSFQFIGGLLPGFAPKPVYTIYVVSIAVILIGFNYFLHWDRANTRVNRVSAAALVLLQSVFAVLAILYGAQLEAEPQPMPVFGDVSYLLSPTEASGFHWQEGSPNLQAFNGQPMEGEEMLIEPDFPLLFFGREYSSLLISRGRLLFGERWSAQKANYFLQPHIVVIDLAGDADQALSAAVAQSEDQITVRWSLPESGVAQAAIHSDGLIELSYQGLSSRPLQSWGFSAGRGLDGVEFLLDFPPQGAQSIPAAGMAFESNFYTRTRLDQWTRPILIFQLVVSLAVIAILSAVRGQLAVIDEQMLAQSLSARQLEIARLVAEGHSNIAIGETLHITKDTVRYHLKQIYHVLGIEGREALADWVSQKQQSRDYR